MGQVLSSQETGPTTEIPVMTRASSADTTPNSLPLNLDHEYRSNTLFSLVESSATCTHTLHSTFYSSSGQVTAKKVDTET